MMSDGVKIIVAILFFMAIVAIGYGLFSIFIWVICWAFDWTFSWKYSFGIWIIWLVAGGLFKTNVTVNNSNCKTDYDRWLRK